MKMQKSETVHQYLKRIRKSASIHLTLIDADKYKETAEDFMKIQKIVQTAFDAGTDGIIVGGSTSTAIQIAFSITAIKPLAQMHKKPIILFPHASTDIEGIGLVPIVRENTTKMLMDHCKESK